MQMKNDGTKVDRGQSGPSAAAGYTVVGTGNPDADLSAVVLWLLDEINALRTLGLIGLSARTVTDMKTSIQSKLS